MAPACFLRQRHRQAVCGQLRKFSKEAEVQGHKCWRSHATLQGEALCIVVQVGWDDLTCILSSFLNYKLQRKIRIVHSSAMEVLQTRCSCQWTVVPLVGKVGNQRGLCITLQRVMSFPFSCWQKNALGYVEKRNNQIACLHGSQLNVLCLRSKSF